MANNLIRYLPSPLVGVAAFVIGLESVALLTIPPSPKPETHVPQSELTANIFQGVAPNPEPKKASEAGGPNVTQSALVHFPRNTAVRVQAIEETGKFPKIVFTEPSMHIELLSSRIQDSDGFLKPTTNTDLTQPFLRFREIRSPGFSGPIIMAIAVGPGGSDHGFFLDLFGEVNGEIVKLTRQSLENAVQGGYYVGFLNRKLGYGLAVWGFIWKEGETHYDRHHYEMTIYRLDGHKFRRVLARESKRKYYRENSSESLLELGIRALDQRKLVAGLKEFLE